MNKMIFFLIAAISLVAAPQNPILPGDWSGVLEVGPMKLTLVLHPIQDETGVLSATVDCLEQGISGLPVDTIAFENGSLKFELKSLKANFEGAFDKEKNEISGQFTQGGIPLPLTLQPGIKEAQPLVKRPQEPSTPFPYKEVEVSYENPFAEGVKLSGTLTLPKGSGTFPVAFLIAGSGPHTRNEEVFGHKIFLVLADHLTRQGIAVLRVDKRGVGKSTGNYDIATSEDFASDALAGVDYLKTREEINPHQIGLIGHSEGGMIAPMVAAKSKGVAFVVLMAGPGVNGEEILFTQGSLIQRADGVPEEQVILERKLREETFKIVKTEPNLEVAEKQLREVFSKHLAALPDSQRKEAGDNSYEQILEENLEPSIKKLNTPWFRFFLTFEPTTALSQVRVPILALNGELDLQVPPKQNLPVIAKALEKARNKDYTIVELPHLNHLFQTSETGSLTEYAKIEETISPSALNLMSDWILERTAKKS